MISKTIHVPNILVPLQPSARCSRSPEGSHMRLGLTAGYSGAKYRSPAISILEAESLGYGSVWTTESYGVDAVVPLAWIAAQNQTKSRSGTGILQMPARTPAMAAMTAMTLDALSGRAHHPGTRSFGPAGRRRVARRPLWPAARANSRVCRHRAQILAPLPARYPRCENYNHPYHGADATGLGKPLKSILHGRRDYRSTRPRSAPRASLAAPRSPMGSSRFG